MQAQIAVLSPQVALYKNQQRLLQMEQRSLNQQMLQFNTNKILRDGAYVRVLVLNLNESCIYMSACLPLLASLMVFSLLVAEIEENKAEVNRLRQLHFNQKQQQIQAAQTSFLNWETAGIEQMVNPNLNQRRIGEMVYANSTQGKISTLNNQPRYIAANSLLDPAFTHVSMFA